MNKTFFISIVALLLSACVAQASNPKVVVKETKAYSQVEAEVQNILSQDSAKQLLIVLDIDNTILTSASDLGSDIWYQWQHQDLAIKPTAEQMVSCLYEDSINLLYELAPMRLTEPHLPQLIESWQKQGITVFALTSRSPGSRFATERELKRAGIDMSITALAPANTPAPVYREKLQREMSYMGGIMMTSGMNKGQMLRYILQKTNRHFANVVFVDDSQKNIDNLYAEFNQTGGLNSQPALALTLFHYTKIEDERIAAQGAVLTQQQADAMAQQWRMLNATLDSIFPARQIDTCLN
ncbi:MAG: DUF2608 domain-containing protein [Paraglaciecola sp.]|nr:DUF2608 domain-containing protein [Paraglaciecola sp.]NCT48400.1 DUF2608 domain-containing protein [Paraglaciecola sp.]